MMVFMGLMFYRVAAGLCIYFIISSLWGMLVRNLLPQAKPAIAGATTAGAGSTSSKASGAVKGSKSSARRAVVKNGQADGPFTKIKELWAELLKQAKKK